MLSITDEKKITSEFLKKVGNIIKRNRERKNISQEELAEYIHVNRTTISRFETGESDMKISYMPLISLYCEFPMSEYIDTSYSEKLINTFARLVAIKHSKYMRTKQKTAIPTNKKLLYKVYEENGEEVIEKTKKKEIIPSYKMQLIYCIANVEAEEDIEPFSDEDFYNYLVSRPDFYELASILDGANKILEYESFYNTNETMKNSIADFILNTIIIEPMLKNPTPFEKIAYEYYKSIFEKYNDLFPDGSYL